MCLTLLEYYIGVYYIGAYCLHELQGATRHMLQLFHSGSSGSTFVRPSCCLLLRHPVCCLRKQEKILWTLIKHKDGFVLLRLLTACAPSSVGQILSPYSVPVTDDPAVAGTGHRLAWSLASLKQNSALCSASHTYLLANPQPQITVESKKAMYLRTTRQQRDATHAGDTRGTGGGKKCRNSWDLGLRAHMDSGARLWYNNTFDTTLVATVRIGNAK